MKIRGMCNVKKWKSARVKKGIKAGVDPVSKLTQCLLQLQLSTSTISRVISCKLLLINIDSAVLKVSCRSGLPKKTQLYIFFDIVNVAQFRKDLVHFIPLIKTVAQVLKDRKAIDDHKKKKLPGLIPLVGVNISFSHKGFVKVRKISQIRQSSNPLKNFPRSF